MLLKILFLWVTVVTIACDDLYQILGLTKLAKASDIKSAYHKKAKETHPDKQLDKDPDIAAEEFRRIVRD